MRVVQQAIMNMKEEVKYNNQAWRKVIINTTSRRIQIKYQKGKYDNKKDWCIIYNISTKWIHNQKNLKSVWKWSNYQNTQTITNKAD